MKFQDRYDIAIIGGGIGGLMTAYRLAERDPGLSICLMERGRDIRDRVCPIVAGKVKKCIKCDPCAIMEGLAGAGADCTVSCTGEGDTELEFSTDAY